MKLKKLFGVPRLRSSDEIESEQFAVDVSKLEGSFLITSLECKACARNRFLLRAIQKTIELHIS